MQATPSQIMEFRQLLVDAMARIDPGHPAIKGFHAAFDERARLVWLGESNANRTRAIHKAIDYLLCYVFDEGSDPTDGCPTSSDESPSFWNEVKSACDSLPDNMVSGFHYSLFYHDKTGTTPEELSEALIHALLVYGNRTRNGLSMSSDPW